MVKTRITYVVMLLIFAGGLWAILRVGSQLHGPPNVAGEWQLQWAGAPAEVVMPDRLAIAQSGQFLSVKLDSTARKAQGVKLQGTLTSMAEQPIQITLGGSSPQWSMNGQLDRGRQMFSGHLDAPVRCDWQARRMPPAAQ